MERSIYFLISYSFSNSWAIEDYHFGCLFYEVDFSFAELQYFCPSRSAISVNKNEDVTFNHKPKTIKEFTFKYLGRECRAEFYVSSGGKVNLSDSNMRAESHLKIQFDEKDDVEFLHRLYELVDGLFAFICNRRNIDCTRMSLRVKYPDKKIENHKIVDKISTGTSKAYFFDKYREDVESPEVISNAFYSAHILDHIDKLFDMVAQDYQNTNGPDDATISISSVPPSEKKKSLIDLEQSLQITGAFEFYVRKYMPPMAVEKPWHTVIKMALDNMISCKLFNNKARSQLKSLKEHVVAEPALEGKIVKAYTGYTGWDGLKACICGEDFKQDEIGNIAKEANQWRNELAHSKRSYDPNLTTIKVVRLMEHMNYAVVLRQIGFQDDEIKEMLKYMLVK